MSFRSVAIIVSITFSNTAFAQVAPLTDDETSRLSACSTHEFNISSFTTDSAECIRLLTKQNLWLATQLSKVTANQTEQLGQVLPSSSILLSTEACNTFGWKTMAESLGRMPIGAGSDPTISPGDPFVYNHNTDGSLGQVKLAPYRGNHYLPLATGGGETVTLLKENLPDLELKGSGKVGLPLLASLQTNNSVNRANVLSNPAGLDARVDGFRYSVGAAINAGDSSVATLTFRFSGSASDVETSVNWPGEAKPQNNMPPYLALYFCKKE